MQYAGDSVLSARKLLAQNKIIVLNSVCRFSSRRINVTCNRIKYGHVVQCAVTKLSEN